MLAWCLIIIQCGIRRNILFSKYHDISLDKYDFWCQILSIDMSLIYAI